MRPTLRRMLLLALCAIAAALAWIRWSPSAAPRTPRPEPPRELDVVELPPAPPHEPETAAPSPTPECNTLLRVRFVDAQRRPIEGVEIASSYPRALATSDDDGRAELGLSLVQSSALRRVHLRARASGFASAAWSVRVHDDMLTDLGELVLGPSGTVRGRVVDEEQRGIEGAELRVVVGPQPSGTARYHGPEEFVASSTSAADGSFEIDGIPVGAARVWAGGRDWLWNAGEVLAIDEGARIDGGTLQLQAILGENVLELAIVDPRGLPAREAQVALRKSGDTGPFTLARADESGRLRWIVEARVPHEVHAIDAAELTRAVRVEGVEPGRERVVLRLRPPQRVDVVVRDERGLALQRFEGLVESRSPFESRSRSTIDLAARADGRASIALPDGPFSVTISAEGRKPVTVGELDPEALSGEIAVLVTAPPRLHGVVREGRVARADVKVTLHRALETGELSAQACAARYAAEPECSTSSAADGTFEFAPQVQGRFYARFEAPNFASLEFGPLDVDPERSSPALEAALVAAGRIEGTLLVDPGMSATQREVRACRGDPWPRSATTDDSGHFAFEGLSPGPWWIALADAAPAELDQTPCLVAAGETAIHELMVLGPTRATLRGTFAIGTRPAARATLELLLDAGVSRTLRRVELDSAGQFVLESPLEGAVLLQFTDAEQRWRARVPLQLALGEAQWSLDLATARLQGRVAPTAHDQPWIWTSRAENGVEVAGELSVDAEGVFSAPNMPAGRLTLQRRGAEPARELALPVGATLDLDL